MSEVELHGSGGEWSAVYVDGIIQHYGDTYTCDEWLHNYFGVKMVDESPWLLADGRTPLRTLAEVHAAVDAAADAEARAAELRSQAAALLKEADELWKG